MFSFFLFSSFFFQVGTCIIYLVNVICHVGSMSVSLYIYITYEFFLDLGNEKLLLFTYILNFIHNYLALARIFLYGLCASWRFFFLFKKFQKQVGLEVVNNEER